MNTSRVTWRTVWTIALGILAGAIATIGTVSVAVAGFALSYDAIRAVGIAAHIRESWAWLLPVSVDGAMAVATVAAVVLRHATGRTPRYPWFVVIAGAAISIVCNGLHATGTLLDNASVRFAVSSIPPIMLALSIHLLVVLVEVSYRAATAPDADTTDTPVDVVADTLAEGFDTPNGTPADGVGETPAEHPWTVPVPLHLRVPVRCATPLRDRVSAPRNPSVGTGTGTPAGRVPEPRTNGAGTLARNPLGTPGDTPATPPAPKGVGPPLTSVGTPRGTGAVKGAGTPDAKGADTPAEYPADEVLLPVLRDPARVPRDPDGTVPVKRAMRLMSVGRNRAIRLLDTAGLTPGTGSGTPDAKGADTPAGTGTAEGSDDDQERHPEPPNPTNGTPQPELIGAL